MTDVKNKIIEDYSLVIGSPGKVVRTLGEDDVAKIRLNASEYVKLAKMELSEVNAK